MMKSINKVFKCLIVCSVLFLASCEPDEETGPDREAFLGTWVCTETSQVFGTTSFQVNIVESSANESQVYIRNFYNLGTTEQAYATISGKSINIPQQVVSNNTISGSGTLSGNRINLSYSVNDGQTVDNVSAVLTK
jgi:hypothetical protein